ncbi:hypothetical protein [Streptomyces sp. S186]
MKTRTCSGSSAFTAPHVEQTLDDGNQRSATLVRQAVRQLGSG